MALKAVVDKFTDKVKGFYDSDISFPINGNYVVELPENFDPDTLTDDLVATLTTAKRNAYIAQHPLYTTGTASELLLASEFSIPPVFGSPFGSQYLVLGDKKGTHFPDILNIPATGAPRTLSTNSFAIPASTTFILHLDAFVAIPVIDTSTSTPTFTKYFYNYNPSTGVPITLNLSTLLTISIRYLPGTSTTVTLDQEFTIGGAIVSLAIQASLNTIPTLPVGSEIHLSSYVLLHRP